jgi:transposase-like protein
VSKERELASGALEGARRATGGAPEARPDGRGRWSAKRKAAAILRLLRGEDIETLSRELGVTAATLSGSREQFLRLMREARFAGAVAHGPEGREPAHRHDHHRAAQ